MEYDGLCFKSMLLQIPSQLHSHTPVYMFTVCCLFCFLLLLFVFVFFLFCVCVFVVFVCCCFLFCFLLLLLFFFQKCVLCFKSWNVLYLATTCTAPERHIRDWIFLKLERVFMKHYAPNICLSLKITWKQGCFKYYTNCKGGKGR